MATLTPVDFDPFAQPQASGGTGRFGAAIAGIESGGRYDALGPVTKKGDRAFGKYQVMGANIPQWTRDALGRSLSPEEFLADPDAQDATFNHRFGQYVKRHGPEGAARAWFAGEGGMNNMGARDALGTTVDAYSRKFSRSLGNEPPDAMAYSGGGGGAANPLSSVPPPVARPDRQPRLTPVDHDPFADAGVPVDGNPFAAQPADPRTMGMAPRAVQEQGVDEGARLADALRERMAFNRDAGPLAKVDAAVRGAAGWLPGMNKLAAAGDAAFGAGQGTSFGERYTDNLARQRALDTADELLNPNARLAGQVAGVVPMAMVTPMVNVAKGAGMMPAIANSAATGATYAGLSGAIESDDNKLAAGATGAALGGALGGALPPVLAGAGKLFGGAVNAVTAPARGIINPTRAAEKSVVKALAADGADDAATRLAGMQQGGAPAVLADAGGESTRALARAAGNISGEARNIMRETLDERFAAQADRVADMIRGTGASNAGKTLEQIQEAARRANRPAYAKAYAEGSGGVINEELLGLMRAPAVMDAVRETIRTAGNKAAADGVQPMRSPFVVDAQGNLALARTKDGGTVIPNVQFWDYVQRSLRDKAESLSRSGANDAARDARALRSKILEQVDSAVPSFADARGGAARAFGAEDALEAGAKFITSRMPPMEARRVMAKMSPAERELFAEGARTELIQKIRSIADNRDVVKNIANNPVAREQMEVALGRDGANRLIAGLDIERAMMAVRSAVQGNSTTAQQLLASGGASSAGYGYLTGDMDPKSLLIAAATGAGARRYADGKVARRVAEVLMSNDPTQIERLLTLASKQKSVLDIVRSIESRVLPLASSQAGTAASPSALRAIQGPVAPRAEGEQN